MGPADSSSSSGPREFATLDLLRFLAAQAVVFYHLLFLSWVEAPAAGGIGAVARSGTRFDTAVPWASLGWLGVPVFFVISGFVILMSSGDKTPSQFAIGRAKRILPGLWTFSLLSAAVVLMTGVLAPAEALRRLIRSMALFPFGPWIDGAIWTLVAEALFYALIFAAIRFRLLAHMTVLTSAITGFNLVFWSGILLAASGLLGRDVQDFADLAASYRLSVTLVTTNCFFLVGIALYQVHAGKDVARNLAIYAINFLIGMVVVYFFARASLGVVEYGQNAHVAAIVWAAAILLASAGVMLPVWTPRRWARAAKAMGLLTYPLYLVNQITGGYLFGVIERTTHSPVLAVVAAILFCNLLAGAFSFGIERRLQSALGALLERALRHFRQRLRFQV
ncbi:acyltransferase [Novosphingobium sp. PY1]|uniref:acyltransferase family protein n=1 Tax=Novosphingobium sp. PY1 TaxID=1882221 RepID=UPI001A90C60D|nr:acyltransferase [Novosphingobium sp. PY1]GFM28591.1 putative uncharacterized protein [Novosphingobium sp. PY1]